MLYRFIAVCLALTTLWGCSKNDHSGSAAQIGPCRAIKQQMLQTYAPQLQRPTTINDAKLLREYEFYNCENR